MSVPFESIKNYFMDLQDSICQSLEKEDGKTTFQEDLWEKTTGGGGRTRIIRNGNCFEKGGVNFSHVFGNITPEAFSHAETGDATEYQVAGISIVIHPNNPHVPIIHMNLRCFEMNTGDCWFGGGIDLTPHYVLEEDARFFHQELKKVCDSHATNFYSEYKKWADEYFFIPHRNETRGIGGIFFDYLRPNDKLTKNQLFEFVKSVGDTFAPTYISLVQKNKSKTYSEKEKEWQLLRRGRYVEFNLVYDRGTKFGLQTNGRIESILMSLPRQAQWEYDFRVEKESLEAKTLSMLRKGVEWC